MSKTIEIIARFEGERHRFSNPGGTSVLIGSARLDSASKEVAKESGVSDVDRPITIKGEDDFALEPAKTYRFLGTFSNYQNKRSGESEKQFHFRTYVDHVPHTLEGISDYVARCGKGCGVGPAKAKRLVEHFGPDSALDEIRNKPDVVSKVASIDRELADRLANVLQSLKATENAKIELDRLLTNRGFPKTLSGRLIKEWGNKAAEIVASDPYRLMSFRGIGFKLADRLYLELGHDPKAIDRQALCLWYSIASDNAGHSWFPAAEMVQKLQSMIGSGSDYRSAIVRGREWWGEVGEDHYGAIATIRTNSDGVIDENGNQLWLAEGRTAKQESRLANLVYAATVESDSESQLLTVYGETEHSETVSASVMRCARCGRALTAETVFLVGEKPFGPVCFQYITA
jgi:hypothetical protein